MRFQPSKHALCDRSIPIYIVNYLSHLKRDCIPADLFLELTIGHNEVWKISFNPWSLDGSFMVQKMAITFPIPAF